MTDNELLSAIGNIFDKKLEPINERLNAIEKKVTSLEVTLENETNRNIKVIAEGHLDLSRKLNEAVRIASDIKAKQEIQDIYLNTHETKLKNIILHI